MSQKIKLLFVNESLALAGGERSLIALLSNLDSDIYDIDLQLFQYGGALDDFIPSYVNILQPIPYTNFASNSLIHNLKSILRKNHFKFLRSKIAYSLRLRFGKYNHPEKAQLYWEEVRNSIGNLSNQYDVAISYAQGVPTFFVNEKVCASKKIAWVNVNVKFPNRNKIFQKNHYKNFDKIIAVSKFTQNFLEELFPTFQSKYETIYDIVDYQSIFKLSNQNIEPFKSDEFNILTVARLNKLQKGYDITLEVCKLLKENNIKFHWYAIGTGPYRTEMENYIKEHGLENHFTLLGAKKNPYPFFKQADLYVQTSRHEGFGLTIAEARLLNIPVVTTKFDTVFMQMIDGKNGLVTDINAEAVTKAVLRLINDKELYDSIVNYLRQEIKENNESIKKFDQVISGLLIEK